MPKIDIPFFRMEVGRVLLLLLVGSIFTFSSASAQVNVFLTTNVIPAGKGQVTLDPEQPVDGYTPGTVVTLTAVESDPCYQFSHWTGDTSGTNPVTTVVMNETKTVNANFAPGVFSVTTSTLSQFVITGSPPSPQTLVITSTGGNCFTWSLQATQPWIHINKTSGTGDDSIAVSILSSQVPCQGTHVGYIILRSVNSDPEEIKIPVLLRVGAEEVTATVTGSPTAISCQDHAVDEITVTITNNSFSQITFQNPPDFGDGFVLLNPDVFPLVLEDNSQAPLNQAELFIRFKPTAEQAGAISSQVKMIANNCGREVYFELTATRIKPTAEVDVTELDFGIINNCSIDPLPVRTIELQNLYVENAQLWYTKPQGFTMINAPFAVAGGASATIEIRAEREGPAIIDTVLQIEVDYGICSEYILVRLTGRRQSPSFYAETIVSSHSLTAIEFDTTCLGAIDTKTLRVINDGNSDLNFHVSLTNSDYFGATPMNFALSPGGVGVVTVSFSPEIAGSFSSDITIAADQCDLSETTTLYGRTFNEVLLSADITPSSIILDNCELEGVYTLMIENTDTETATFTGPPAMLPEGFEWDDSLTYPLQIPAGETESIHVYFRPPVGVGGVFADTVNWFGEPCGTKVSFFLSGERVLPTYTVTPTTIDLGMVVNCDGEPQDVMQNFTFENTSGIDMVVNPQTIPDGLEILADSAVIPAGGVLVSGGSTVTFTVKAVDRDPGEVTATITFDVIAGEDGVCSSTFDITVTGTWYTPSFVVEVVEDGNIWDPLCVGTSESKVFVIRNTGNIQIEVTSSGFGTSPFTLMNEPFSIVLNPDAQMNIEVRYTPDARGTDSGMVTFTETICNTTATLNVYGSGVEPMFEITDISPEMPLDILTCEPDDNRAITVTVANTGDDLVTLFDYFLPDGFSLAAGSAFPISLDAGEDVEIGITFTGTEVGTYSGTAEISAEECGLSVTFDLQVNVHSSTYTLSSTEFDFGDIRVCPNGNVYPEDRNNLSQSIEITNTGTTAMMVNATFALPHPNVSITSPPSSPFSLAPGQTKFLTIVLSQPFTNIASINASLQIVSSRDTICSLEPTIIPITAEIRRVSFAFLQDSINANANLGEDSVKMCAIVQNTGEGDITLGLDLSSSTFFSFGGTTPITLEPGETDTVCVYFNAEQIGTFTTLLRATDEVCQTTDEVRFTVTILQGGVVLMGNDIPGQRLAISSRPGDFVEIPIYLNESLSIDPANYPFEIDDIALSFDMEFNVYDLAPESLYLVSVDGLMSNFVRTSPNEIHVTLYDTSFDAGLLAYIRAEVLLGTSTTTEWSFLNPEFSPLVAFVELDNNTTGTVNIQARNGFTTRRDLGIPWLETPTPNPVSRTSGQSSTIEYNIVNDGQVEIRMYNQLGIEVAVLENAWKQKGVHSVVVNSDNLPNGMYHVVMTSGSFHSTQKLILGR